ncbi:hypothetical protein PA7559_11290 [Pseudoalteromonas distincta]
MSIDTACNPYSYVFFINLIKDKLYQVQKYSLDSITPNAYAFTFFGLKKRIIYEAVSNNYFRERSSWFSRKHLVSGVTKSW